MTLLVIIIALALIFDYINGFHDAANSIATIVSTKVLTPFQAVLWAAMFNVAAYFIFKDHAVANTISKTVQSEHITLYVILAGLIASIFWNLLTWWYGIPSSSSHTLIGGFAGAAITHAFITKGFMPLGEIIDSGKVLSTILFIFLAPLIGMLMAMIFTFIFVSRNTWWKSLILIGGAIGIWFGFAYFQEKKLDQNFAKYLRVEKYTKDINDEKKAADLSANQLKLQAANTRLAQAKPYFEVYEKEGADAAVKGIMSQVDFTEVKTAKLGDQVGVFFKVDQLKAKARRNDKFQPEYDLAKAAADSLKPLTKLYHTLGHEGMIQAMIQKYPIAPIQLEEMRETVNVDVEKDLYSEFNKADNRILRYSMIAVFLLFVMAFIYVEKLREPSASRTASMFKRLQLLSSAAFSIGHGGNDAQKVMGIIAAALVANGDILDIKNMPDWVPISCYLAIGLGTLSGGWKIVKTMGTKITKVTPLEGVSAETAGATTLFLTEQMGIPVSTTHTITGAIIGVGATKRLSAVRWGVTVN
ncbi:MAG: inorganic phosphate transporter, partial [Flavitalea sp.]